VSFFPKALSGSKEGPAILYSSKLIENKLFVSVIVAQQKNYVNGKTAQSLIFP
jgi:hypothetical protein